MEQTAKDNSLLEAILEWQKPYWHIPTNLGINQFKRDIKAIGYSKHLQNKLAKAYKKRAWMEFESISRGRGTAPTHPKYGKSVAFTTIDDEGTTINVKRKEK